MTAALDVFLDDVAQSAYGWPESLRFTYTKVGELIDAGVPGSLVECGVGNGAHPAVMWRACYDRDEKRPIHLFDSFQGVPNGGVHDVEWNEAHGDGSGRLEPTGVADASLAAVQANLERWGCDGSVFKFWAGWFQETVPPVAARWARAVADGEADGIAFLRLDGDLYESTLVCLRELYPLVVSGGCVVIDDWNLDGCRRALHDFWGATYREPTKFNPAPAIKYPLIQPITESGDVWWRKP